MGIASLIHQVAIKKAMAVMLFAERVIPAGWGKKMIITKIINPNQKPTSFLIGKEGKILSEFSFFLALNCFYLKL